MSDLVRLLLWGILALLLAADIASNVALNYNFQARVEQTKAAKELYPQLQPKECKDE